MKGSIRARRTFGLLMLALATLLALGAALGAADAEAKKKKEKKINVVQCVANQICFGTEGRDRLAGTDSPVEFISGGGGNDV